MKKIQSLETLKEMRELAEKNVNVRLAGKDKNHAKYRSHILVCGSTGCRASLSQELINNLNEELKLNNLEDEVQVVGVGCFGFCEKGTIVQIHPEDIFYVEVKPIDAKEIIREHIIKKQNVERLFYVDPQNGNQQAKHTDMSFYRQQMRIALRNCGLIDPEKITDYIAVRGYEALATALLSMTPEEVIEVVKDSGLRGRGGAGFSTGLKWEFGRKANSSKKYVICNADEGDPGAFMDRSILEGDPHTVLEAMAIAAYTIGADEGVIYIRAEYPLAVERLYKAIAEAKEYGVLGNNIFGTDFNFEVKINLGAGAFVCGEETSLINSVEGGRGEPRVKPPFPAQSGLWNKPTNVNNVETYANIPPIILNGASWYKNIGTDTSAGTKVFALTGKINNVGLVEVPMGITINEIIHGIGGGIRNKKQFKAIQTGGPSGGCIPASMGDLQIDYNTLASVGSMMGSGGMIVMDEDDCMVDIAKYYLDFTVDESCGKCTPCRIGNRRLLEILERITKGAGTTKDLDDLKQLGSVIRDCSLCALGQTAPNPVLSTMKYFYEEYEAHVLDKKCPAGKCTNLLKYEVIPDMCIGCTLCARNCPASCIDGERKLAHFIRQEDCIKCGVCLAKCPVDAIVKK